MSYLEDSEKFNSRRADVNSLRQRLLSEISNAVTLLLRTTGASGKHSPQMREVFFSPFIHDLLSKVYGTTTKPQLEKLLHSNLAQSFLDLGQLLRVLLAADISHNIFEKQDDRIPQDPTERAKTFAERRFAQGTTFCPLILLKCPLTWILSIRVSCLLPTKHPRRNIYFR